MFNEYFRIIKSVMVPARLWNIIISYFSYIISSVTKKCVIWGNPTAVMIEPTNICNLRCPLCPSGNQTLKRSKGYMRLQSFRNIIDEVYKTCSMIILWNQGEPFLNKDLVKMIEYASYKNIYTLISTNGNLEIDPYSIVKSGLGTMIVSLDGATQETYNKYRINGDLEKVITFVKSIVKAKKELNSLTPIIKWQFIVMKHNEHEIEKIKYLAQKIGVDNLSLKSVQIYNKSDIENFLPKNPKFRRYKISEENDFELKYGIKNKCKRIWTRLVVNWSGEVSPCCFDKDIEFSIGNIDSDKISHLWKNKKFNSLRKQILKDRSKIEMCKNCGEGVVLNVKKKNFSQKK